MMVAFDDVTLAAHLQILSSELHTKLALCNTSTVRRESYIWVLR
jgi:hypothetical protein